jgi:hypothetical protein
MIARVSGLAVAALILASGSARAQGRSEKPIVISKAAVAAMSQQKAKTKAPLTARLSMMRRASASSASIKANARSAPTSVRAVRMTSPHASPGGAVSPATPDKK